MNKLLFFIVSIFILFSSCQDNLVIEEHTDSSQSGTITTRGLTENVCIASWNTQLLDIGDLFGGPQCEGDECDARAIAICNQVSTLLEPTPAIVNFQEVFEADAAAALISCMESKGYPFNTGFDPNQDGSDCFLFSSSESEGSGLITFSKFPIVQTITEDFEDCNGCIGDANDCYSEKGVLLTEIEVSPGCKIFNFNTHLDAGRSDGDIEARENQLNQIKNFLANNVPDGAPLVLSGDFNIDRNTAEYSTLVQALGAKNTALLAGGKDGITSPANGDKPGRTLDYIFADNINEASYTVYYQTTTCWWEYREEIKVPGGIKELQELDLWDLDPNGDIDLADIKEVTTQVTTHRYWNEEDIPEEHINKVRRICRNVEKEKEKIGEQCAWIFSASIHVLIDDFEPKEIELLEIVNSFQNYEDIPNHLVEYYTYECTPIFRVNPSDHNPVLSCVEFNCEE